MFDFLFFLLIYVLVEFFVELVDANVEFVDAIVVAGVRRQRPHVLGQNVSTLMKKIVSFVPHDPLDL